MSRLQQFFSSLGATISTDILLGALAIGLSAYFAWDVFVILFVVLAVVSVTTSLIALAWVVGYTIADRFRQ